MLPIANDDYLKKVLFCQTIFDFKAESDKKGNPESDAKHLKRTYLLEMIAAFDIGESNPTRLQLLKSLAAVFKMINTNIFRTLKNQVASLNGAINEVMDTKKDEIEEIVMLEISWPHL